MGENLRHWRRQSSTLYGSKQIVLRDDFLEPGSIVQNISYVASQLQDAISNSEAVTGARRSVLIVRRVHLAEPRIDGMSV